MIQGLQVDSEQSVVSWTYDTADVMIQCSRAGAVACMLSDASGVAVVEPCDAPACRNAVVYNGDGTERFRVIGPEYPGRHSRFIDVYYVMGRLTFIQVLSSGDVAHEIDEMTGAVIRSYETR